MCAVPGLGGSHCCCSLWWQQRPEPRSSAAERAGGGSRASGAPGAPPHIQQEKDGCGQAQKAVSRGFPQSPHLIADPHICLVSPCSFRAPVQPLPKEKRKDCGRPPHQCGKWRETTRSSLGPCERGRESWSGSMCTLREAALGLSSQSQLPPHNLHLNTRHRRPPSPLLHAIPLHALILSWSPLFTMGPQVHPQDSLRLSLWCICLWGRRRSRGGWARRGGFRAWGWGALLHVICLHGLPTRNFTFNRL